MTNRLSEPAKMTSSVVLGYVRIKPVMGPNNYDDNETMRNAEDRGKRRPSTAPRRQGKERYYITDAGVQKIIMVRKRCNQEGCNKNT